MHKNNFCNSNYAPAFVTMTLSVFFVHGRRQKPVETFFNTYKTRKVFKKKHTCGLLFAKLGYTF